MSARRRAARVLTRMRLSALSTAVFALMGCDNSLEPDASPGPVSRALVSFDATPVTILADGIATTKLVAHISPSAPIRLLVTFSTTLGTLVPLSPSVSSTSASTVNADTVGDATIYLRAGRVPGTALVSATGGGNVINKTIDIVAALPESIELEPSAFKVQRGFDSTITLTARLRRTTGLVTPGVLVSFRALNAQKDSIGRFGIPTLSNDSGLVKVRYAPADTLYTGPVFITAKVKGARPDTLQASTTINVTP